MWSRIDPGIGIVFILISGLFPATSGALEFSVGVGLSNGKDNAELQQDFARLQQDIRALRTLERQLERLAGQEAASDLQGVENAEWRRQSDWLLEQAGEVAELADEAEEYLQDARHGAGFFDYQAVKFKSSQRLDTIRQAAKKYAPKGKAAVERQNRAVELIARTY